MVSGTLVDTLLSPSLALNDLFSKTAAQGKTDEFPAIVREHFSALFAGDALDQVPIVDTSRPPNSYEPMSLVRFRAMVQDTSFSPEMYLSSFNGSTCAGWGLESEQELPEGFKLDSEYGNLKEREVIWAVSIPGEGHWCQSASDISGVVAHDTVNPIIYVSRKPHKFPIPNGQHVAVLLKVYDNSALSLKPTSVHEFIGTLTSESIQSEFAADVVVPVLHVLFHRPVPKMISPLILPDICGFQAQTVRNSLVNWISSEALGGDPDAAEWTLLSCLSSVESRSPPLLPMSITLSQFTKPTAGDAPAISLILGELLPLYLLLPLTLDLLNERNFLPESRDEDLHAGVLQIPEDTTILVTETGIVEGKLLEKGIENVKALQEVAKLQTLPYKFPFSQYSFPTDINFIVITEGKQSLFLDSNVVIPLRPDASANLYKGKESINWPSPELLSSFREYIIRAKTAKISVNEEVSNHIKNDFVQERQENNSVTPDDLIRQMSIARLIARSRLESQMSLESWNLAKALDNRRKARIV